MTTPRPLSLPSLVCGLVFGGIAWLCTGSADATGILTDAADARSMATAGAFAAVADDASAIVVNPAGLRSISAWGFLGGFDASRATLEFAGRAPYPGYGTAERAASPFSAVPEVYAARRMSENLVVGIGLHAPLGLLTEWRRVDLFPGRYLVTRAEITSLALTPALSFDVSTSATFGIGLDLVRTDVTYERRIPGVLFVGGQAGIADAATMTFDADPTLAATFRAGALVGRGAWQLGLVYRHELTSRIDGDATFVFIPSADEDANPDLEATFVPPDQAASIEIAVPSVVTLGIARTLGESWRTAVDVSWERWSAFERTALTLDDPELSQVLVPEYDDAIAARAGAEFFASDKFDIRFGYAFESASTPEESVGPIFPDAARHRWAAGFGYHAEGWQFDLYQMLVVSEDVDAAENPDLFIGRYGRRAWQFGVSLGYSR